jgi:hypothetical protein
MTRTSYHAFVLRVLPWLLLAAAGGCRPASPLAPSPAEQAVPAKPKADRLFTWEGRVDGRDTLKFRNRECLLEHEAHQPVQGMRFQPFRPIDPTAFPVTIVKEQGRGKVEIIRQGDEFNAYTLVVRVDDQHFGGAGFYRFSAYRDLSQVPERVALSLYAKVDDEAIVEISGNRVVPQPWGGSGVLAFKYDCPDGRGVQPGEKYLLRVLRGRGEVELLPPATPSGPLRIRIRDKSKGSSVYVLELLPARDVENVR